MKRIELFFLFIEPADLDQIKVILINEYPTVTTNGQESIFLERKNGGSRFQFALNVTSNICVENCIFVSRKRKKEAKKTSIIILSSVIYINKNL